MKVPCSLKLIAELDLMVPAVLGIVMRTFSGEAGLLSSGVMLFRPEIRESPLSTSLLGLSLGDWQSRENESPAPE